MESDNFPKNYVRGPYGNKERFGVDLTDYSTWKNSGRRISTKIHPHNYTSLLSGKSINVKHFVESLLQNQKDLYSLLSSKFTTERLQDDYFFHVNMTKDAVGYTIESHTDAKENIFTILFYVPETDENREFGLHVCEEEIEFIPNRMIIFAPSGVNEKRPATWHGVKRLSNKLSGTRNSFQMFFYKNR